MSAPAPAAPHLGQPGTPVHCPKCGMDLEHMTVTHGGPILDYVREHHERDCAQIAALTRRIKALVAELEADDKEQARLIAERDAEIARLRAELADAIERAAIEAARRM